MKAKMIMYLALLINLMLGNLLIPMARGQHETLAGKIFVHSLSSIVAIILLLFLFKIISSTANKYKLFILPLIFSYLVVFFSIYLVFVVFGLNFGEFKSITYGVPIALISSFVFWPLWLPMGMVNLGFAYWYSRLQA